MKNIKLLTLLLFFTSFLTCERDDLCPESTPTTPGIKIGLFDSAILGNLKNVSNLYISDLANNMPLEGYNNVNTNEVILPLKTTEDSTQYLFIKDYSVDDNGTPSDPLDDVVNGMIDIVTINYTREDVYVSRACGYKTIFKNVVVTIDPGVGDPWIIFTEPLNDNLTIEDETITHYSFYH